MHWICENVNAVWLVLIELWLCNLVWGEFRKLNHLCSKPLNSIGTTWNYSIFRARFSIEKFFDNFVITILILLGTWWTFDPYSKLIRTLRIEFTCSHIKVISVIRRCSGLKKDTVYHILYIKCLSNKVQPWCAKTRIFIEIVLQITFWNTITIYPNHRISFFWETKNWIS